MTGAGPALVYPAVISVTASLPATGLAKAKEMAIPPACHAVMVGNLGAAAAGAPDVDGMGACRAGGQRGG